MAMRRPLRSCRNRSEKEKTAEYGNHPDNNVET